MLKKKICLFLSAVAMLAQVSGPQLYAAEATADFNVTCTVANFAHVTMGAVDFSTPDITTITASDWFVSASSGTLTAQSNDADGWAVTVAKSGATTGGVDGWDMKKTDGAEVMVFSLLASHAANGTASAVTTAGTAGTGATGGTEHKVDGVTVMSAATLDTTLRTTTIYGKIYPGEIDGAKEGSYSAQLTMTITNT